MDANAYELLALCMRYVFAVLIFLIVLRSWRITLVDGRRASKLRKLSPETGIVGEFLVVDGHERSKNGMRYPVTLEGTIGSGRDNDIRLRSSSIRRRHAIFQMTEEGLYIRNHARSRIRDGFGRAVKELTLRDGDYITIGGVRLMLILSGADRIPVELHAPRHANKRPAPEPKPAVEPGISRDGDDLFEVGESSAGNTPRIRTRESRERNSERFTERRRPRPERRSRSIVSDDLFDTDERYDISDDTDSYYDDPDDSDDVFYDYDEYDDC